MAASIGSFIEKMLSITIGGTFVRDRVLAPQIAESGRVGVAIDKLSSTTVIDQSACDEESPVFVLSAGWGTGSTLVQRLIISSGEVLVWGEPLDQAAPVQRLSETVAPLRDDWPPEAHYVADYTPDVLSKGWIANMIPDVISFKGAHKAFLASWLNQNVGDYPYRRWGMKEVRLTIDHAKYLKWLYPNAKFVFVYRDLYSCYLSCRNKPWTSVWPKYNATPIVAFAHHWKLLLEGFVDRHQEVDGILLKYEDLCNGNYSMTTLQDYLGLSAIDASLLEKKVGGRSANRRPLIFAEKLVLDGIAGDLRKRMGYK